MQRNKKEFIAELIKDAQDSIWKYELAISYNEQHPKHKTESEAKEQIEAAKLAMEKDIVYLAFLREQYKEFAD